MKKINTVLLIDDDLTINYYHNRLISKSEISDIILVSKNGKEGLATFYNLNNHLEEEEIVLIFLDLNMPIMNGWEFLDTLFEAKKNIKINYEIYILSSTINPDDKNKAIKKELVSGFLSKPLTKENIDLLKLKYCK